MLLTIVRHGETIENLNGIVQGHCHGSLSEQGLIQAKCVADRLKGEKFDAIISSDLGRAKQTAEEIAKYHGDTKLETSQDLRECASGIFDGRPREDRRLDMRKSRQNPYSYRPEGGENFYDVEARIKKFLNYLFSRFNDKNVLIITHGRWIKLMFNVLNPENKTKMRYLKIKNTGITKINISDFKNHKVIFVNSIDHLCQK